MMKELLDSIGKMAEGLIPPQQSHTNYQGPESFQQASYQNEKYHNAWDQPIYERKPSYENPEHQSNGYQDGRASCKLSQLHYLTMQ